MRLRSVAVACLFIAVLGTLLASYVWLTADERTSVEVINRPECDRQLSAEIGSSAMNLCLQLVQVATSTTNSSELSVPVMIMKPGSTTSVDILYLLAAATEGHVGPLPNITASKLPVIISVPSATIDTSRMAFSNATVIFQNSRLIIYRYTLRAAADSNGYYAILPPYYFGMYPALAVGADPNHLDMSSLALWSYSGVTESQEFAFPSYIVATGDLNVVNVTLPITEDCSNQACNMISHSQS